MAAEGPRHATVADIDEFNYIPDSRTQTRRREYLRQMNDVFKVFDQDLQGIADVRSVGVMTRAMGLNPTEAEVLKIVEMVEEPESTGYIKLDRLRDVLLDILMNRQFNGRAMVRHTEDEIYRAFTLLDTEKKGYITSESYKELLTTMGEKFSNEELLEALNAAADPDTGFIYYEEFAPVLASE